MLPATLRLISSRQPLALRAAAAVRWQHAAARPSPTQVDNLTAIGTRSIFTSEHDAFRETVRKFFNDRVVPFHNEWEEQGCVSRELWQEAGEAGLLGVTMPEKYGGAEVDVKFSSVTWEEQSYTGCTGPGFALHSEIVMPYILHYGTEEQKQRFLPAMARGECIGAIAMTEPGAGSDLQGVATTAVRNGDDYVLNGSKVFITNGQMADVVIVVARTDPTQPGSRGISLFLVERGMKGFEVRRTCLFGAAQPGRRA